MSKDGLITYPSGHTAPGFGQINRWIGREGGKYVKEREREREREGGREGDGQTKIPRRTTAQVIPRPAPPSASDKNDSFVKFELILLNCECPPLTSTSGLTPREPYSTYL